MSVDAPVDIHKQTIHALIPGLDYQAVIRINKLRRLSIIGIPFVIAVGFSGYAIAFLLGQFNITTASIVVLITAAVYIPIQVYLIRKWSKEWNKKFQNSR